MTMQQTHAKRASVREQTDLPELLEDTLRLLPTSLDRADIVLEAQLDDDPFLAERNRVLEILVNLLTNACDALETQSGQRMIAVRGAVSGRRLRISVRDTGVGFTEEVGDRIFGHSFTTKKDGHGFGLHNCANAANEMGGWLTCSSPGPNQGAEFVLELPIKLATPGFDPFAMPIGQPQPLHPPQSS